MTAWGKYTDVKMLPEIESAEPFMIYRLPDGTDWLSSKQWCSEGQSPIWRPVQWAFGIECDNCGGSGAAETELYEGLTRCWKCVPDPDYVS